MNTRLNHLSREAFFIELANRPGLIPIAINVETQMLCWADMERHRFYEGFFHKSLNVFRALKGDGFYSCTTGLNVLEDDGIVSNPLYPTAFIFHAGRCGSTLLAKVLSRATENNVLSEPDALNAIWDIFTQHGKLSLQQTETEYNKTIYRNLLLTMARKRLLSHQNVIVKFTSFNIHFFDFINSVFPDVPAIFLTRPVEDIVASYKKSLPGWYRDKAILKILTGGEPIGIEECINGFIQLGCSKAANILKVINYPALNAENLSAILHCLNLHPSEKTLGLMQTQFLYDSKQDFKQTLFNK